MSKNLKFSMYDILILIMVLLCVLGIFFRGAAADGISSAVYNDTAEISFVIEETDKNFISAIRSGDKFYFKNGSEFGTLLEGYSYKNTETYTANEKGDLEKIQNTEKYDLQGRFISNGRFTDNGFLCSSEKIFINSEIELHSKDSLCVIKVIKIENVTEGNSAQ